MDFFFNPGAVALIGATPNRNKGGYSILQNLQAGFPGPIYPVNPNYREIEGLSCYRSVADVSGKIDLAIVFVPAQQVIAAVEDCVNKGIPGVIIESGGFAEAGLEGGERQRQLSRIVRRTGIRIWGPNCMGLVDVRKGVAFSFMSPSIMKELRATDGVSLIVQSGMLSAGFLLDLSSNSLMGISKACSIGNKVDVNENDLLQYLIDDPETETIALYLESFSDGRRFADICRRSDKPIVLLKGGRSAQGAKAALSHTASLAGDYRLARDVLAQVNVVEAQEFKQMMDIARSLNRYSHSSRGDTGKGVAVLTFSGGAGILAADFLAELDIPIARLSAETTEKLGRLYPPWMPVANPVDLWPAIERNGEEQDVFMLSLEAALADDEVSGVCLHIIAGAFKLPLDFPRLAELTEACDKPVVLWVMGERDDVFSLQKKAADSGVLVFPDLLRASECLAACLNYRYNRVDAGATETPPATLSVSTGEILNGLPNTLDEYESKMILRDAGIPTVAEAIIDDEGDIPDAFASLGFPLAIKGLEPGVIHKTERGLVALNIDSLEKARQVFRQMKSRMTPAGRVLFQKQMAGPRELIVGYLRDPLFGPCVMLGLGGIMTEIVADRVFAAAPVTFDEAGRMMDSLRGRKILDSFRGQPPVDREMLARILVSISELGSRYPGIKEMDINPLCVEGGSPVAVDAAIVLDDPVKSGKSF